MLVKTDFIIYDVVDTSQQLVEIDVRFGYGQTVNSFLQINELFIKSFNNSFQYQIDLCSNLKGKTVNLLCSIHDTNPVTDKVSLEVELKGGKQNILKKIFDIQLDNTGDVLLAILDIYIR